MTTVKRVPLTQGFFVLVDEQDYEKVAQFKWHASVESRGTKVYAVRWAKKEEWVRGRRHKVRLHRWLLGLPPFPGPDDPIVDHDNEDSLDCTRENLVQRTQAENMAKVPGWKRRGRL